MGENRQRKFMIKKLDNDSIDRLVFASQHMVQINIFVLSHKKAIKVIWRIRYLTTVQYLPKRWEPLVPETQRVPHCLMIASTYSMENLVFKLLFLLFICQRMTFIDFQTTELSYCRIIKTNLIYENCQKMHYLLSKTFLFIQIYLKLKNKNILYLLSII